jgi:hypothetical protein
MIWVDIEDDKHVVEDDVLEVIKEFEREQTTAIPILPLFDDFAASIQVDDEPEPHPFYLRWNASQHVK